MEKSTNSRMDNMLTIYLDMDGVICDFNKEYKKTFGLMPAEVDRDKKEFSKNWVVFCEGKHFEKLDWWPGAKDLLDAVSEIAKDPDVRVEMLTSTGIQKYHESVKAQKNKWLSDHGISYFANCVPGRTKKKYYAEPWTVLIDDTDDVIDAFNENGGYGILHRDVSDTITLLKSYYMSYLEDK
jgi:hypothetical protein